MILAIYGSGGLGRETYELASLINEAIQRWDKIIFVDDVRNEGSFFGTTSENFSTVCRKYRSTELEFAVGLGEPIFRKELEQRITDSGYDLATLIHPKASISSTAVINKGTIIRQSIISSNANIGKNIYVQDFVYIGHDSKIGDHSMICSFVATGGFSTIEECSFIGMHVAVKEKTSIGKDCIVGAGAMVLDNLPNDVIAFGSPAKPIRKNIEHRVFR